MRTTTEASGSREGSGQPLESHLLTDVSALQSDRPEHDEDQRRDRENRPSTPRRPVTQWVLAEGLVVGGQRPPGVEGIDCLPETIEKPRDNGDAC